MNLAKIIAEGEMLHANRGVAAEMIEQIGADAWLSRFYVMHGHALLAVAKAAVEWDEADAEYINSEPAVPMTRLTAAEASLRLAVRGDAKGGDRG